MICARSGIAALSAIATASAPKDVRFIQAPCGGERSGGTIRRRVPKAQAHWISLQGTICRYETGKRLSNLRCGEQVVGQLRIPLHRRTRPESLSETTGRADIDDRIGAT